MDSLIKLGTNLFADGLSLFGIPAGTVSAVFSRFMETRLEEAQRVLFDELRQGRIDPLNAAQEDHAVAIIYRYMLALRDFSARRNLRLLASVIAGLAPRDRLFADDFNKYAEALSRLTRDEILVLGTLYHHKKVKEAQLGRIPDVKDYWKVVISTLVPEQFPTEEHVIAICCSAQRSGLIATATTFGSSAYYGTSPFMDEVSELTNFTTILRKEGDISPEHE